VKDFDTIWEGSELCKQLDAYAVRAHVLLMPILAGGHWALLVVDRADATKVAPAAAASAASAAEPAEAAPAASTAPAASAAEASPAVPAASAASLVGAGCQKCTYSETGCKDCSAVASTAWFERLDREAEFFEPCERVAPLQDSAWWDIRYYDSLREPSLACSEAAHALLHGLQSVNVQNPMTAAELRKSRHNRVVQPNCTACGFYVLHFIETEMRRSRGEGQWPASFDIKKRSQLLTPIWTKFRSP
jgi:Ulp1 family protease